MRRHPPPQVDNDGDMDVFHANQDAVNQLYQAMECVHGQGRVIGSPSQWCWPCPISARGSGGFCHECDGGYTASAVGQTTCSTACMTGTFRTARTDMEYCSPCAVGKITQDATVGNVRS